MGWDGCVVSLDASILILILTCVFLGAKSSSGGGFISCMSRLRFPVCEFLWEYNFERGFPFGFLGQGEWFWYGKRI